MPALQLVDDTLAIIGPSHASVLTQVCLTLSVFLLLIMNHFLL